MLDPKLLELTPKEFYALKPSEKEAREYWDRKDKQWRGYGPLYHGQDMTSLGDDEARLLGGGTEGK